jgi:hypothetical protein
MPRRGQAAQVRADLGHHDFRQFPPHAEDRIQQGEGVLRVRTGRLDRGVPMSERVVEAVNLAEQFRQQHPVMGPDPSGEGLFEGGALLAQFAQA